MNSKQRNLLSDSEQATAQLGAAIARSLPVEPPSRALRVHLSGDLGAGKTTLVRGLLRELGVQGSVRSPTFSLLEHYQAGPWTVLHLDLYRLSTPEDVLALGLADHDSSGALWIIEWPERAGNALPRADLEIRLRGEAAGHQIEILALGEVGGAWLAKLGSIS